MLPFMSNKEFELELVIKCFKGGGARPLIYKKEETKSVMLDGRVFFVVFFLFKV